jgi:hypothetical protein
MTTVIVGIKVAMTLLWRVLARRKRTRMRMTKTKIAVKRNLLARQPSRRDLGSLTI